METLQSISVFQPDLEVKITSAPRLGPVTINNQYMPGGRAAWPDIQRVGPLGALEPITVPGAFYTRLGVPITFTAVASGLFDGATVSEYYWRFGDGFEAYGATVAHTYNTHSLTTQVTCRVTDSLGNTGYSGQAILLQ